MNNLNTLQVHSCWVGAWYFQPHINHIPAQERTHTNKIILATNYLITFSKDGFFQRYLEQRKEKREETV